jgi:predicted DNA-binding transcriptional regulator YafY
MQRGRNATERLLVIHQLVTELPGGGSHMRMHLSGLDEVERWVLSWGTHAMVMQPQVLAERVGSAARELARRYVI